mmetsp:Transcript_45633/g.67307  ORF Transcript_45633/g.67307 Transcript_45633/m.67307 type:complete len:205 (-) Transcript_45633:243-857(-)|eukprot:CAMPEP_0195517676 /NCGR_PEP_ID=MMETSP0794_2-20130614/11247_1 /TAXON_ID=515487 /ORGANISM="Stephanopyxis turris, Strain CCMP 815" /LENGTH=204 /DNA_ID=CAMNT_0040646519 /DNA_START=45 /DNA_END=659 /DNA_ORIENTATION=+
MKSVVAVVAATCLAGSIDAFTGTPLVSRVATKSALQMSVFDDYVGASDYRGKKFEFDPLNLAESYPPFVPWFRECELRHGRTAMLAVMGFIATDFIRLPGAMYSFEAIPKTIDAHDALLKSGPMYQLALWIGLWDIIITAPAVQAMGNGEREPGDYAWLWFAPESDDGFDTKRAAELLNGRLAMIAVGGIATQSIVTGHGFPYV